VLTTTIRKTAQGLGLDLGKARDGLAHVLKLKDMPEGAPNPAAICSVPLAPGDVICAVNGQKVSSFTDTVRLIRAAADSVTLTFVRI
jgi:S1-C subfamily serine protease